MSLKNVFLASFFVGLMLFFVMSLLLPGGEILASSFEQEDQYVVVIDPGHGGFDGGAVAVDGTVEKDINLQIAKALYDVIDEYPVKIVMTRKSDISLDDGEGTIRQRKRQDLVKRKELIEEADADLTISIHLNSYPADASVCGAQVFYPKCEQKRTEEQGGEQTSKLIAQNVQKSLEINVDDGKERSALAKDDVLLLQNPSTPIILVECGFLSNVNECEKLKTLEYQALVANAIWEGINIDLGFEKKQKIQVIHSANKTQKMSYS